MKDSYRHKGLRMKLIKQLREKGINNERILDVMAKIPRHLFLDNAFEEWAYKDVAFSIGYDQTISQPYTVAFQTNLLEVRKGLKILEIGTGSGYQACVLHDLGAKVYTIERQQSLFVKTSDFLIKTGYERIRTIFGDGYAGIPKFSPFDRIIITASCETVPVALKEQLAIGGTMVVPRGNDKSQRMLKIVRVGENEFEEESFGTFSFVPFLKGVVKKDQFMS